jgi:hypothetical protein
MNNFEKDTQLPKTQILTEQSVDNAELKVDNDELKEDELEVISGGCGGAGRRIGRTIDRWLHTDGGPNILRRF